MIRMIKGTYGLKVNGVVEAMTKRSAPFSLSAEREAELVKAGVAAYVEETAEEKALSNMKMAELRKTAAAYGVDASKCRSKGEAIMLRPIFYDLQLPWLIVADLPDIMT